MREILFRGKVADEPDEWVYGYLLPDARIIQTVEFTENKCCGVGTFQIRPETVEQYTGLTDKNGKKIFEGDIVKEVSMRFITMEIEESIFAVEWWDFDSSYRLIRRFDNGEQTTILTNCGDYEVIGNIHDNPELLK